MNNNLFNDNSQQLFLKNSRQSVLQFTTTVITICDGYVITVHDKPVLLQFKAQNSRQVLQFTMRVDVV